MAQLPSKAVVLQGPGSMTALPMTSKRRPALQRLRPPARRDATRPSGTGSPRPGDATPAAAHAAARQFRTSATTSSQFPSATLVTAAARAMRGAIGPSPQSIRVEAAAQTASVPHRRPTAMRLGSDAEAPRLVLTTGGAERVRKSCTASRVASAADGIPERRVHRRGKGEGLWRTAAGATSRVTRPACLSSRPAAARRETGPPVPTAGGSASTLGSTLKGMCVHARVCTAMKERRVMHRTSRLYRTSDLQFDTRLYLLSRDHGAPRVAVDVRLCYPYSAASDPTDRWVGTVGYS
jgi:hypothetical protein